MGWRKLAQLEADAQMMQSRAAVFASDVDALRRQMLAAPPPAAHDDELRRDLEQLTAERDEARKERDAAVARAEKAEREREDVDAWAERLAARDVDARIAAAVAAERGACLADLEEVRGLLSPSGAAELALSTAIKRIRARSAPAPAPQPAEEPSDEELARVAWGAWAAEPPTCGPWEDASRGERESMRAAVRAIRARLRPVVTDEMVERAYKAFAKHPGELLPAISVALEAALGAPR